MLFLVKKRLEFPRDTHINGSLKLGNSLHLGYVPLVFVETRDGFLHLFLGHLDRLERRLGPNHVVFDARHWHSSSWTETWITRSQQPIIRLICQLLLFKLHFIQGFYLFGWSDSLSLSSFDCRPFRDDFILIEEFIS